MGNRKLPFGYQMRMGEIVRNEPEAKAVQDIFLQYSLGASLKEIAEQMSKTGPSYDEGKSWNKNMIARILENAKYTGADSYPELVDINLFEAAAEKRQTKQRLPERTPAQKALKRVCSKPPTPEIEQQVMHLFGRLAEQPERITQPEKQFAPNSTTQAELDEILNTQPLDEDTARSLICKLAQEQYDAMQIAENIKQRVSVVANQTIEKLKQFDETLASTLAPKFKKDPAWDKAFSFSLTGDEDIPINKRGSGVRRLILFSFFRASCEEDLDGNSDVIYAVEEPETSQHPNFQQTIINTFLQMTENPHCQIIFTTHVPGLVKLVPVESLRYITNGEGYPEIETGTDGVIARIADSLGVLPDITPPLAPYRNIRLIVCVEGVNDILFLQTLTTALHKTQPEIRPILSCQDVMVLPMGGSSLQEWVNHNYLRKLGIPEYHIYDSDCVNAHQRECDIVNQRTDGSSARMTSRREMENYIHPDAIRKVYDADFEINDETDVPSIISDYLRVRGLPGRQASSYADWARKSTSSLFTIFFRSAGIPTSFESCFTASTAARLAASSVIFSVSFTPIAAAMARYLSPVAGALYSMTVGRIIAFATP